MGIKLKNIPYNIFTKFIGLALLVFAMLTIIDYQYLSSYNSEYFYKDSYYETDEFQQNYVRLSHNVVEKELDLIDEKSIEDTRIGNDKAISLSRLSAINDNLRRSPSFIYLLVDKETGQTITNIPDIKYTSMGFNHAEEYISSFETVIQWDSTGLYFPVSSVMADQPLAYRHYNTTSQYTTTNVTASDVVYRLREGRWIYYTAVDFSLMEDDILFGGGYYDFRQYKEKVNNEFPMLVFSVFAAFFAVIYLSLVIGKTSYEGPVKLFFYDYIPLEIQAMILVISIVPLARYQASLYETTDINSLRFQLVVSSGTFVLASGAVFLSVARLVKTKYIYKNPITFKIWWLIKSLFTMDFDNPLNKYKIFIILIGYVGFNVGSLGLIVWFNNIVVTLFLTGCFLLVQIITGMYVLSVIKDLTSLIDATRHRANGDTSYPIDASKYQTAFQSFANDLNELQNGLQLALDDAIRGEKMKTELITNVSHDLKNPLTSIITYLDLLEKSLIMYRQPGRTEEDRQEIQDNMENYINILSNKGYRLKTLIEDLVSASKASSGNLDVELMDINLRQMLVQILADREEYFYKENLKIVFEPERGEAAWALVDPNHMYRVFENLISNILKYTLKGTRVFIEIDSLSEDIQIIFKNVSNHPLEAKGENLAARFVRGDDARSTEGSGLGLSIVESLLKLQDGSQEIIVDGDMFKAVIRVPKGENPHAEIDAVKALVDEETSDSELKEEFVELVDKELSSQELSHQE